MHLANQLLHSELAEPGAEKHKLRSEYTEERVNFSDGRSKLKCGKNIESF